MKKSILLTLLSTLILQANSTYIQIGIGLDQLESADDDGINLQSSIGTTLPNGIGLEMKLTKSVTNSIGLYGNNITESDLFTTSLFTNYTIRMDEVFSIVPKIGITYHNIDLVDYYKNNRFINKREEDIGFSYGVDLYYDLNDISSVYGGITTYNPKDESNHSYDSNTIYIGYKYNFDYNYLSY
jgi:hypothetical protein